MRRITGIPREPPSLISHTSEEARAGNMSLREGGGEGDERAKSPPTFFFFSGGFFIVGLVHRSHRHKRRGGRRDFIFLPPPSTPPQDPNRGKRMRKEGQDGFFLLSPAPHFFLFPHFNNWIRLKNSSTLKRGHFPHFLLSVHIFGDSHTPLLLFLCLPLHLFCQSV